VVIIVLNFRGSNLKTISIGKYLIPLWLIVIILVSGAGVGAYYVWRTLIIPVEVKEPLEVIYYPSQLSLFPGETKEFIITVQNYASVNYSVTVDFHLSNTTYQANYVTFSNKTYRVVFGQQNLTAWLKVRSDAPQTNVSLIIDLNRANLFTEWQHRRIVNITEKSGFNLTNFPVTVTFEHYGNVKTNGTDIRIVDDTVEIPSYVEKCNNTHATVVFEINLTALESRTFYVYYGNPAASLPNYPLVPLTIFEGQKGNATIDNKVYIGWDYTSWGWSNDVELWNDFRIDFNGNNDLADDSDLIRDYGSRQGGIGRSRKDLQAYGLGEYKGYVQTPIFTQINFGDAWLRVYKNNLWIETIQADDLNMFSNTWDHANYGGDAEINIEEGQGYDVIFDHSFSNPGWMAFRDNSSDIIFASSGFGIDETYEYCLISKEHSDFDRRMSYDIWQTNIFPFDPYDQPANCRIYWYGAKATDYTNIERMAQILNNQPTIIVKEIDY
jgi:hypothetical protein